MMPTISYEGYYHQHAPKEVLDRFPIARKVTTDTFFLGTSPVITDEQLDYIETIVKSFFNKK